MPRRVEHRLIVDRAAAVIFARVVRIVAAAVAGRPAGAVGLPLFVVLLPAVRADGDPRAFPIDHADAILHMCDRVDDVADVVCLSLHRERIVLDDVRGLIGDRIARKVGVLAGIGIGGLHDHHLLAVGFGDAVQHVCKVFERAVPIRIIGRSEHVVIDLEGLELLCKTVIRADPLRVCQMHRDERVRADLTHGLAARLHQLCDVFKVPFAAQGAVRLVAELHHADNGACLVQLRQRVLCERIERVRLFLHGHVLPRKRNHLLAGVRPEVGIVEVHDQLHAVFCRARADLDRLVDVVVAAAVAVALRVVRMVPYAHADMRDAVFRQRFEHVLLLAGKVIILYAALLLGNDRGRIHAHDEIVGQVLDLPDIQRAALDLSGRIHIPGRFLGRFVFARTPEQHRRRQQQDHPPLLHCFSSFTARSSFSARPRSRHRPPNRSMRRDAGNPC